MWLCCTVSGERLPTSRSTSRSLATRTPVYRRESRLYSRFNSPVVCYILGLIGYPAFFISVFIVCVIVYTIWISGFPTYFIFVSCQILNLVSEGYPACRTTKAGYHYPAGYLTWYPVSAGFKYPAFVKYPVTSLALRGMDIIQWPDIWLTLYPSLRGVTRGWAGVYSCLP